MGFRLSCSLDRESEQAIQNEGVSSLWSNHLSEPLLFCDYVRVT